LRAWLLLPSPRLSRPVGGCCGVSPVECTTIVQGAIRDFKRTKVMIDRVEERFGSSSTD
jgi:hypothetical protein